MGHTFDNPNNPDVKRYDVPGINALNFVSTKRWAAVDRPW